MDYMFHYENSLSMNWNKVFLFYWTTIYYYNNRYILWVKRNVRQYSNMVLLLTSPYIVGRFVLLKLLEPLFTVGVCRRRRKERFMHFDHEIAIVAIAKNEGPYLREWIEYHRLVGIKRFYLYDNESEDDTRLILQPYIEDGTVVYTYIKGKARQLDAYNDAIRKYRGKCRYMAFIDLDEYLKPTVPFMFINNIVDNILSTYGKGASGVGVNWAMFGSSGYRNTPEGLTVMNFKRRGTNVHWANAHVKTIVNPREVSFYISPHYPLYKLGAYSVDETGETRLYVWFCDKREYRNLRINHYYTKSLEQYMQEKAGRGFGDRLTGTYDMKKFREYDLNDVEDKSMEVYADTLKERMG